VNTTEHPGGKTGAFAQERERHAARVQFFFENGTTGTAKNDGGDVISFPVESAEKMGDHSLCAAVPEVRNDVY
jgi:hypothetical protein